MSARTQSMHDAAPAPRIIEAALNYLAPMTGRPRTYTYEPPPGVARSNLVNEARLVPIASMRGFEDGFSLDREGFAVLRRPSVLAGHDYDDEAAVRRLYYRQAEQLIAEATGADRVFVFDHTIRRRVAGAEDRASGAPRQPATRVHVDHTEASGPQRVRDFFGAEADALLAGRVQIVNLWRPISGPLRDAPLAMCDAGSVAPADLIASDLIYPDRVGETYSLRYDSRHRWHFLPDMRPDEALLLKCYDAATDGRARFSPHTAFEDPTAPADRLPRESIELRTLVFNGA